MSELYESTTVAGMVKVTRISSCSVLPNWSHPHPLGAIGENRKDLGNTNIQERILKKLYPKAS